MSFDWEQLKPDREVTEPHKLLVREIGENFLMKGTGIPDHQKKVQLRKERNLLNELVQLSLIRNNWNRYYPAFQALYYLSDSLRNNYAEMLHLIFKAIQALYESSGPQQFSFQQVEQQLEFLISASGGALARTLKGGDVHPHRAALFLQDFKRLVSVQESNNPDTPVSTVVATENILDYEDLQQAWREELPLRPRVRVGPPSSTPSAKQSDTPVDDVLQGSLSDTPTTRAQPSVYISHASEDLAWMGRVATYLVAAGFYVPDPPHADSLLSSQIAAEQLRAQSRVFIILVSRHYIDLDEIGRIELPHIRSLCQTGERRAIPIILEPCPWQSFLNLPRAVVLPDGGSRPLSTGDDERVKDDFHTLAQEVRRAIQETDKDRPLLDAYTSVRLWYQANIHRLDERNDEYSDMSRRLILALPDPTAATQLEMRAVMAQVISGGLEWAYAQSDGRSTMSEYAKKSVEPFGGYSLSDDDRSALQTSVLWKYLGYSKGLYYRERAQESSERNDTQAAEVWLKRALDDARQHRNLREAIAAESQLATLLTKNNRAEEALPYCQEALSFSELTGDYSAQLNLFLQLGNIQEVLGRLEEAQAVYERAVAAARELASFPILTEALEHLGTIYQATGKIEEAEQARHEAAKVRSQPTPSPADAAPTPKIVSDRWSDKDALGYEAYARTLAGVIAHEETIPPLTIGIKAPWGAGKTSLMKMIQHILDGEAAVTEENESARRNRGDEPVLTLRAMLKNLSNLKKLKEAAAIKIVKPTPSEVGKRYGIDPRITVWFNAWKYQTSEQIWAGLAHCIISQVTARMKPAERELFWLRLHARRVDTNKVRLQVYEFTFKYIAPAVLAGLFITLVAAFLLQFLSLGIAKGTALIGFLTSLAGGVWKASQKLGESASGAFRDLVREPDYEGKLGFLYLVESDIRDVLELVANGKSPLVIFVDDLDRCVPHKVAEVVEAINLSLCGDYPNCIFVLGMEPGMVAAALEVANKEVIEKAKQLSLLDSSVPLGWRFMEKIVQLPISIPPPTAAGVRGYTASLTGIAAATEGERRMEAEVFTTSLPLKEKIEEWKAKLDASKTVSDVVSLTDRLMAQAAPGERLAVAEASKQKYAEKFMDRDPLVNKFLEEVVDLVGGNPRQIKRYVNVFRFHSTLRHNLKVDSAARGFHATLPSDKGLAKYIALTIQWPQAAEFLRGTRATRTSAIADKSVSLLNLLEEKSRTIKGQHEKADAAWVQFLRSEKLDQVEWVATRSFRQFLAQGESLSEIEGCGLW
jgi:tetratricopeptide (TPR) repeat protein